MLKNLPWFNQPIGKWDTKNVADFSDLLLNGRRFNQDLSHWNMSSAAIGGCTDVVKGTPLQTESIIFGWQKPPCDAAGLTNDAVGSVSIRQGA